ncbi:FtsX-like permease family protein [Candidatus Dojkabacteria bacterium]|nr:FtsX-like permease family protein [Candidatus Dojkabacteria bacterium]
MNTLAITILVLSAFITIAILLSAGFSPIARRIGFRNITRRIDNTVLVILGSMVGAALISGSLVLSDSLDKSFYNLVEKYSGEMDALVTTRSKSVFDTGVAYLDEQEVEEISQELDFDEIDGVLPFTYFQVSPASLDDEGNPDLNVYIVDFVAMDFDDYRRFGEDPKQINAPESSRKAHINKSLAKKLELDEGDKFQVPIGSQKLDYQVDKIYEDGEIIGDLAIAVDRASFNQRIGLPEGAANQIYLSAKGGVEPDDYDGEEFKATIEEQLANFDSEAVTLSVIEIKEQALDGYGIGAFADAFLIMSMFGVFAGVLLIANLYLMLAAERKYEMGILRAVALTRGQLMKTFVYEGFMYSLLSSAIGALTGVGIGYVLVYVMNILFTKIMSLIDKEGLFDLVFDVQPDSLVLSFAFGFLITIATSIFASWRISRLNIVSAIRNTEEEKEDRFGLKWVFVTFILAGLTLLSVFSLLNYFTVESSFKNMREQEGNQLAELSVSEFEQMVSFAEAYSLYVGVVFSLIFGTFLLNRVVRLLTKGDIARITVTITSTIAIVFTSLMSKIDAFVEAGESASSTTLFFLSGIVLVIAMALIVTYNLAVFTGVVNFFFSPFKKIKPIAKIAFRYPSVDKAKTGLTLVMFSIVIFLIVYTSMMKVTIRNINEQNVEEALGGYDVLVIPSQTVGVDTKEKIISRAEESKSVTAVSTITHVSAEMPEYQYKDLDEVNSFGPPDLLGDLPEDANFVATVDGLPENFVRARGIGLSEKLDKYGTDEEVWEDVIAGDDKVVLGAMYAEKGFVRRPDLELGQKVKLAPIGSGEEKEYEVVGIVESSSGMSFGGDLYMNLITSESTLESNFAKQYRDNFSSAEILVDFDDEVSVTEETKVLKRSLINYDVSQIMELEQLTATTQSFMEMMILMFQGFLGLSLVVGASGLAIIVARSVQERKQQIGMLRSLGFQKRMILISFFMEATFITFLGILIGISMGTIGALNEFYIAFKDQDVEPSFAYTEVLIISGLVYLASLLFSLWPSIQASRLSPVEATNYPE